MTAAETLDVDRDSPAELARKVRELREELAADRALLARATRSLAEANRREAILERDHAVAAAERDAGRRQLDQDRLERGLLTARIADLVGERDRALAAMGWWSRRRYERRQAAKSAHPASVP